MKTEKIELEWECCIKSNEQGAKEGSKFILDHIIKVTRTHPRAFGSFIRVLGKYSRDEKLFPLEEGIKISYM